MSIYQGSRINGLAIVTKDGRDFSPETSQDVRNHSPDGFEWGYGGSGPAQLALALLLDAEGMDFAERHYQEFKRDCVARWDEGWTITTEEIHLWAAGKEPPKKFFA